MTYIEDRPTRSDAVADRSPAGRRRGPWVAAAGSAVSGAVLLAIRPNLVATTLASPRALAFVVLVTLAVALVSRLVIVRFVRRPLAQGVARAGLVGAVAVALLAPSFRDTRVEEALPGASTAVAATGPGGPASVSPGVAPPPSSVATAPAAVTPPSSVIPPAVTPPSSAIPPAVAPASPATADSAAGVPPAPSGPSALPSPVAVPTPPIVLPASPPTTAAPVDPTVPVELTRGALAGLGHRARGTASLYRLPDGRTIVRLEDIDIEPGPDYDVYLVAGAGRQAPSGGRNLGDLKANQGSQNYDVPGPLDEGVTYTVLIWCERFAVPVANATQRPV